jgi:hypothetical protein
MLSPVSSTKDKKGAAGIGKKIKEAEKDGSDGSSLGDVEGPPTPTRKLPVRKARVLKFTEESEEDEDMDENDGITGKLDLEAGGEIDLREEGEDADTFCI